jgi:hypothetical protein
MADAITLLKKYRAKSVVLDANLMVLYLIGRVNRRRIPGFKRTQNHTIEDFRLLERLLDWFGGLVSTPHVFSQATDLAKPYGHELRLVRSELKALTGSTRELYQNSQVLAHHPVFEQLGLADSALAAEADRGALILTADINLQVAIERRGKDALNFNHLRDIEFGTFRETACL